LRAVLLDGSPDKCRRRPAYGYEVVTPLIRWMEEVFWP